MGITVLLDILTCNFSYSKLFFPLNRLRGVYRLVLVQYIIKFSIKLKCFKVVPSIIFLLVWLKIDQNKNREHEAKRLNLIGSIIRFFW